MLWLFITEKRYKMSVHIHHIRFSLFNSHETPFAPLQRSTLRVVVVACTGRTHRAIDILYNRIKWLTAIWNDATERE